MTSTSEDIFIPLQQARIAQVEVLNADFVMVVFSNGDTVKLEQGKLRHLALTSGTEYVSDGNDEE